MALATSLRTPGAALGGQVWPACGVTKRLSTQCAPSRGAPVSHTRNDGPPPPPHRRLQRRTGQCSPGHKQARRPAPRRSVIVRSQNPLFPESLVNAFTVAIKQSPLNAAKKMMAVAQAGAYDEAAVKAKVDSLVADNPVRWTATRRSPSTGPHLPELLPPLLHPQVVVFSWSGCPFCKKAKALLDGTGARYLAVELDEMDDGNAIRAELAKMTDRTSVPNVFIAGKSVGGCNDGPGVATLLSRGELTPMLQAAGAL